MSAVTFTCQLFCCLLLIKYRLTLEVHRSPQSAPLLVTHTKSVKTLRFLPSRVPRTTCLHRGIVVNVSLLRTNHTSVLFRKLPMGISYFLELLIFSNFSFPFPLHLSDSHFIYSEGNCSQDNPGAHRILNYSLVSCVKLNGWFSKFKLALTDSKIFIPKTLDALVGSLHTRGSQKARFPILLPPNNFT
jgi:hypothetical protein